MKEVTTTKYETSDGTRFNDKAKAQGHELKLWFTAKATTPAEDGTEGRLTAAGMLDFIGNNPADVASYLEGMGA